MNRLEAALLAFALVLLPVALHGGGFNGLSLLGSIAAVVAVGSLFYRLFIRPAHE